MIVGNRKLNPHQHRFKARDHRKISAYAIYIRPIFL